MAANPPINRRLSERPLYIWIAILTPIIVLAGFGRTYYLKGVFGTPALPGLIVHVHGLVMSLWVVLFVTQIALVATHRTAVHRKVGVLGSFLALLVFAVGVLTALFAAARGDATDVPPLQFLIIPLGDMVLFAILVGAALYYRRRLDYHKRLMLLAALNLLTPAIARIPLNFIQTGGPIVFFGLTDILIVGCIAFDTIKNRRIHPAFLWGGILLIVCQPLRIIIAGTGAWTRVATILVDLVK
jgi:hypothetical protein